MSRVTELPFHTHTPTVTTVVYNVYRSQTQGGLMASTVLSFRTEEETVTRLDQLAVATERDRQYHLKRALSRYLESEAWHLQAIAEGIADAETGNLSDLASVKANWVKRVENNAD